jgi:GTP-binding protein
MQTPGSARHPAMPLFQNARFLISAHELRDLPPPAGPEIAFAGRSNAGKSSVINTLSNRTRLAFVSRTPGRTQLINFFALQNQAILVDLPGYGFAKVPEAVRRHWEKVLGQYLQTRPSLFGMVLVMDARHPLTPLDRRMLDWFSPSGRPVHILLTKADKLSRQEAAKTLRATREAVARAYPRCSVQLFSSLKRTGLEEVEKTLAGWLQDAPATQTADIKNPRVKGEENPGDETSLNGD